jgi:WD40 repeat protein
LPPRLSGVPLFFRMITLFDFQVMADSCLVLPRHPNGKLSVGATRFEELFGPEERGWFLACRAWVRGGPGPDVNSVIGELLEFLDADGRLMARVHLECARLVRDNASVFEDPKALRELAAEAKLPFAQVRDLALEMASAVPPQSNGSYVAGASRPASRTQHVTALLVEYDGKTDQPVGVVADLCLELVEGGAGEFYPAAELAFLLRDPAFRSAEAAAEQFLRSRGWWPADADVRWRLVRRDDRPMALGLGGESLGGCFALGLVKLVSLDHPELAHLTKLSLVGSSISAALHPDGRFAPVEAEVIKMAAAAEIRDRAQVYTLLAAQSQAVDFLGLEEDEVQPQVLRHPRWDLHVIKTPDALEAFTLLQTDLDNRWRGIDCALPPRNPDFVGRARLFERVGQFIEETESGYLLLEASMGKGKTSFMTELIYRQIAAGQAPIYHFVGSHTAPGGHPEGIVACFYDRLRHKYKIPELSSWATLSVGEKLERVLLLVSRQVQAEGRKEVLYLEAADQAELGGHRTLVPGLLSRLPPGILCIISSRPIGNTIIFGDDVTVWNIDDHVDDREDILVYMQLQNGRLDPPLAEDFIKAIVSQQPPPLFFTVATCLRKLRSPSLAADRLQALRNVPAEWSRSPEELVKQEMGRRLHQAEAEGISVTEFWRALGLMALAREPLARQVLESLGLFPDAKRERILTLCGSFFEPRLALGDPRLAYVFAHPGYIREIVSSLGDSCEPTCHRLLAEGCRRAWRDPQEPACRYALQHWPYHLRRAHSWDALCEVLTDLGYLELSLGARTDASAPQGDALERTLRPALTPFDLVGYYHRSLDDLSHQGHPRLAEVQALCRVFEEHSHALQQDPTLLSQFAYNELASRWGPDTALGRQVRDAVCRYTRPWLRRINTPQRAASATVLKRLPGHKGSVLALAFSQTEDLLASGGRDKKVRLWDARTGKCLFTYDGHTDSVTSLAFLTAGHGLVSGSRDGTVRIWTWETGTKPPKKLIRVAGKDVLALALSPDGRQLATGGGEDYVVRLWDLRAGTLLREFRGHWAAVRALAFSPAGDQLASGAEDNTICLWSLGDPRVLTMRQDTWVHALAYSPDGRVLITGGGLDQGIIRFWDTATGEYLRTLPGHTAGVCSLAFSPDGQKIASGSYDRTLLVRETGTGAQLPPMAHGATIHTVAFSRSGNLLASGGDDRVIREWEINQGAMMLSSRPPAPAEPTPSGESMVYTVRAAANGRLAVSGGRNQNVRLWDVVSGLPRGSFAGHPFDVTAVALSPDSKRVASGSYQEVRVWTPEMARLETVLTGHESWVLAIDFSTDGRRIVTGSEDRRIMIWDANTGRWLRTLTGHTEKVRVVAFSPDSRWVASGAEEDILRIWDAETGQCLRRLAGHDGHVVSLAFFSDNQTLASAGTDETIRIWDLKQGRLLTSIEAPGGEISALAVSPDGRLLAAGCVESTVRLWEAQTGKLLAYMTCQDEVLALNFSQDTPRDPQSGPVLNIADAGGASHVPNFYVMELSGYR